MRVFIPGVLRQFFNPGVMLLGALCVPGLAAAGITHTTDPSSFDYGDQRVGTTSSAQTFTITNESGVSTITISVIGLSGTNPGDFSIGTEDCTAGGIGPGGTCTVDVSFAPTATGARAGSLDFTVDFGVVPSATLDGNGIEPAVSIAPPSPLDLGSWNVGATSTADTVTITNSGTDDLILGTLALSGTDAGDFNIGGDLCSGQTVAPAGDCTFEVTITPSAGGARSAQVDIPSDAPTSPDAYSLSGTGVVVGPAVGLSPDPVAFGGSDVGVPTSATTVTLTNTGNQTLNVGTLGVSGTNAGDFALSADTCSSAAVAASLTCTFDVTFTPSAQGARSGQVDIPSDAPTSPDALGLSGTGTGVGIDLSPPSVNFANQLVGNTSSVRTVTLTNTGVSTLNVGSLGISGTNSGDFSLTADNCSSQALDGGANCTFGVTFTPGTTGARSAQVDVPSDAPSSPDAVALSGNGISPGGGFQINAGMSGSFFDPNFDGQGINIEILGQQSKGGLLSAVVYWYSFDSAGYPFFSFGVGQVVNDMIEVDMLFDYDGAGPFFGPGWNPNQFTPLLFARAVITAVDCNSLLFQFNPVDTASFEPHLMVMERITNVVGVPCNNKEAVLDEKPLTATEKGFLALLEARSGSYYDPAFNGQGINIEVLSIQNTQTDPTSSVLVYWYGFDPRGFPFFTFGVGSENNNVLTVRMLVDYDGTGPFFGPDWDTSDFDPVDFADVTIVWESCPQGFGTMTFEILPAFEDMFMEHEMSLRRLTTLAGTSCP